MRSRLSYVLLALGLAVPPAHAAPHTDHAAQEFVHGTADGTAYYGMTCGLSAQNDDTGTVGSDPDQMVGDFTGGPITIGNPLVSHTMVECVLQLDQAAPGGVMVAAIWQHAQGPTVAAHGQIWYVNRHSPPAAVADVLYLCTTISWYDGAEHEVVVDQDPTVPGPQCRRVLSV